MSRYFEQQSKIDGAQSEASRASGRATNLEDEVKHLQKRFDTLAMTCRAMWELIRDRTPLTDEDVETRLAELQQSEGEKSKQGKKCGECGRAIVRRQTKCLYCGAEAKQGGLFE